MPDTALVVKGKVMEIHKSNSKVVDFVENPLALVKQKNNQKKMKNIKNSMKSTAVLAAILILAMPAISFAATYMYVTQSGQVNTVIANSPALAIANAPGIAAHSGVVLVSNSGDVLGVTTPVVTTPVTYGVMTYAYVNQSGTVVTISANSSASAYANAVGIDENSGVMLLSNTSGNNGVVGDHVTGT